MTVRTRINRDMIQWAVEHRACWTPAELRAISGMTIGSLLDTGGFVEFVLQGLADDGVIKIPARWACVASEYGAICACAYGAHITGLPPSRRVEVMNKLLRDVSIVDAEDEDVEDF
jgi:hypothetical protein